MSVAPTPRLLPITELNRADRPAFAEALRPLFEAADPLAERLYADRPYASYDALLDRAAGIVGALSEAERVAVVNAHPRIGEDAGVVRATSALSYQEQGYDAEAGGDAAALGALYRTLADLNRDYEAAHGFRFVVFVAGRPKSAIVEVLRERIGKPRERELTTALADMVSIARDRLRTLRGAGPTR